LVGILIGTDVQRSWASGNVQANWRVGGLVGDFAGTIEDAYATGSVTEYSNGAIIGGLVGYGAGSITNAYSSGAVTGTTDTGGLVGMDVGGTFTNVYWDTQTSGEATSAAGTGLTSAQMQVQGNFSGWDFTAGTGVWLMPGSGPPLLQ
jgi:hypothetical protein